MTLEVNSFIASQILGDGGRTGSGNIIIGHGTQWQDYLIWKRNIALTMGLEVSGIRVNNSPTNLVSMQSRSAFTVVVPKQFAPILNKCPVELIYNLTPLGLLLWWLDDGSLTVHEKRNGTGISRFGYLCTEAFDKNTNEHMSGALLNAFGIETTVHIDRGGILGKDMLYYRLYLSATSMRRLIDIVRPYIQNVPASMLYKLNMDYRPNRLSTSLEYSLMYNF